MTSQPADDILRHWKDKGIYLLIPGGWEQPLLLFWRLFL
jgi:hypothetical protein